MLRIRSGLSISQEAHVRYFLKHENLKKRESGKSGAGSEGVTCEEVRYVKRKSL